MSPKVYDHYSIVPKIPKVLGTKKKRPKIVAVVDEDSCTGCQVCIPFCPVDCIEPVPADKYDDHIIPPVNIRYNECIGCRACVWACEKLTWNAISMQNTDEVETLHGITIE